MRETSIVVLFFKERNPRKKNKIIAYIYLFELIKDHTRIRNKDA